MDDLREMLRGHVGDWREAAKIREANAGKPGMEGHVAYGRGLLRAAEIVEECLLATEPAPARPPEPLGSVLDRLADPAADWEQAKADLRTVLTQPVNDPAPEEAATQTPRLEVGPDHVRALLPAGTCIHCGKDICAQIAEAYDAGRESAEED